MKLHRWACHHCGGEFKLTSGGRYRCNRCSVYSIQNCQIKGCNNDAMYKETPGRYLCREHYLDPPGEEGV